LHVTFEEGTWAAWLYDLLKPHGTELVVCDPRKNALLRESNKSDKIDARKLAHLLRVGYLCSVYHGENGLRTLKELARSYATISKDFTRVMNGVKALYRGVSKSTRRVIARSGWGLDVAKIFLASGSGRSVFSLDIPFDRNNFRIASLIGIGAAVARRPLPHHRAYGSVHGGSSQLR
jgi:hypothetical protein